MLPRRALALDLGGTQVRAALVAEDGTVQRRMALPTDVAGGPAAVLDQFEHMVAQLAGADGLHGLTALGVAAPGPLDSDTGTILGIPTLPGWEDFPLRAAVQRRFGWPVIVEGDGIAAACGEWRHGAGQGLRHLVYVTVSTGLGGGVVMDGRLLHGRRGMACHVGHLCLAVEGPRCSCGAIGCFEVLASGSALGREARAAARRAPDSLLGRLSREREVSASDAVAAARAGDPVAVELLAREATWLGIGFRSLLHAYSPERIVVGGGVSQAFDLLEPGIRAVLRGTALAPFREVPVVPAALGDNAGLVGVASLALEQTDGPPSR
jgi:glucokinase